MAAPQMFHRMLMPDSYPYEARRHCPHVLETWLRHSPQAVPASRDFEDWAENAHFLHALSRHGRVEIVGSGRGGHMNGDTTPMISRNPDAPRGIMWGSFSVWDGMNGPFVADLAWNSADCVRRVQDHYGSAVFLAAAGRTIHVCDADKEQIVQALQSLHDSGVRRGFVKTRAKGTTSAFDMGEDRERLFRDMDPKSDWGWHLVQHEGARKAMIVQEGMEPRNEYRVMVVGRTPVGGAGCIVDHTPCDHEGRAFDDRMEVVRDDRTTVRNTALADRYAEFAFRFARDWADENGDDVAYALDLCLDARDGRIKAIEMNPMMNLGLYANDPTLIVSAMLNLPENR